MYCARGGILHVYEKGSYKGKLGTYSAGATIQVVVNDQGKVEYLRNGERLKTSSRRVVYPLYADVAIHDSGGSFSNVHWVAFSAASDVVVFQSLVGVSSSAGVIKRTKSGSGWNAGAVSQRAMKSATDTVRGISAVCDRNDKYQMIGLNSKSTSSSYSDIDFAMYCRKGGTLYVYEKGSYKGKIGTYSAGATIQVVVNDQGKVEYPVSYTHLTLPTKA